MRSADTALTNHFVLQEEAASSIILLGQRSKVAQLWPCTEELISAYRGAVLAPQQPDSGVAMITFTSGTTGAAKGVCITHNALVFQVPEILHASLSQRTVAASGRVSFRDLCLYIKTTRK